MMEKMRERWAAAQPDDGGRMRWALDDTCSAWSIRVVVGFGSCERRVCMAPGLTFGRCIFETAALASQEIEPAAPPALSPGDELDRAHYADLAASFRGMRRLT